MFDLLRSDDIPTLSALTVSPGRMQLPGLSASEKFTDPVVCRNGESSGRIVNHRLLAAAQPWADHESREPENTPAWLIGDLRFRRRVLPIRHTGSFSAKVLSSSHVPMVSTVYDALHDPE